jgi:hypothetical protein
MKRAAELGVTRPEFLPGAKQERAKANAEVQVAALNGIASRAEKIGDKQKKHNVMQRARSLIERFALQPAKGNSR